VQALKVPPKKALLLLQEKVAEIESMRMMRQTMEFYDFVGWCSKTWSLVDGIYRAGDIHPEDIRMIGTPSCSACSAGDAQYLLLEAYASRLIDYIGEIERAGKLP